MAWLRRGPFRVKPVPPRGIARPGRGLLPRTKRCARKVARDCPLRTQSGADAEVALKNVMIRKLKSGDYRLYSRKRNPDTGARRNLGTFPTLEAAKRHEREVQFFKRH